MPERITTITTPFIFNISVNCYLVSSGDGFVLVDTARAGQRRAIERALASAGCQPGNLKLIVLTHGDFDHSGNAAFLCGKFGAPIAMHQADSGMVEYGDMLWNRNSPNAVVRAIMGLLIRLDQANRFTPDVYLKEGDSLAAYGFDATVIELPGHSKGNVGLLTAGGDLFCGDLLSNRGKPEVWSLIDDRAAMQASVDKVKSLAIKTIYPGHGEPFPLELFTGHNQKA